MFKVKFEEKSQALLEVAILSAVLIFVIGILVNIGMSYNRGQDLSMRTFRNALWLALSPFSREYSRHTVLTVLEDKPTVDSQDVLVSRANAVVPYVSGASVTWTDKVFYDYSIADFNTWLTELLSGGWVNLLTHWIPTALDLPADELVVNGELFHLPNSMYNMGAFNVLSDATGVFPFPMAVLPVVVAFEKKDNWPFLYLDESEAEQEDYWDEWGVTWNYMMGQPTRMWHWRPKLGSTIERGDIICLGGIDLHDYFDWVGVWWGVFTGNPAATLPDPSEIENIFRLATGPELLVLNSVKVNTELLSYVFGLLNWTEEQINTISWLLDNMRFLLVVDPSLGFVDNTKHSYNILDKEEPLSRSSQTMEFNGQSWDRYDIPGGDEFGADGVSVSSYYKVTNVKNILLENTHQRGFGTVNYWNLDTEDRIHHNMKLNEFGSMVVTAAINMKLIYDTWAASFLPPALRENLSGNVVEVAEGAQEYDIIFPAKTHGFEGWVTEDPEIN